MKKSLDFINYSSYDQVTKRERKKMVTQSLLNQISSIDNLEDLMYLNEFVMNTRNQLGKNTLSVGSKVWVVQKTKRTEGVITKMKVKKALVQMNGMLYNVPFSMLESR